MKRFIALAALLLAASACATTGNTNTQTANVAATPAATATPPAVTDDDIIAKERQTWDWIKSKDWASMGAALADDFVYVTAEGVYDKAGTLDGLKKLDVTEFTLSDFRVVKVDADLYVVTHNAVSKGTYDGKPLDGKPERDATAWANRGGRWLIVYHQDNRAEEPQPSPSPGGANADAAASNTNANAAASSASPAASPAAVPATAADAERQVWEAFKRKDWETFAGFLPPDYLEVEPSGVYTKEQSLEGIKRVDFTNATLSDVRELKVDADAAVVTYVVKSSDKGWPPGGMRHSTVWTNRGGRWQAHFHMGTTAMKSGM